jgi:hypothetical protein
MADVQVVSPAGELGSIDETELPSAVSYEGYRPASPEDIKAYNSQKEFGTSGQQARTVAEEAARVLSFGASDLAQTQMGVKAREILGRKEENPGSRLLGAGLAMLPAALSGEAETGAPEAMLMKGAPGIISKLGQKVTNTVAENLANPEADSFVGKILKSAASTGVGSAVEGAAYTTGDLVDEKVLGDPNLTGQSALAQLGFGSVIGGGLGTFLGAGKGLYGAVRKEITPEIKQAAMTNSIKAGADEAMANNSTGFSDPIKSPAQYPAGSIEAIMQQAEQAGDLLDEGMPSKQMLADADKVFNDSKYPVHKVQLESLDDPNTRQFYKNLRESNTDSGKALTDYEALQKKEGVQKINETVQKVAPDAKITGDSTAAYEDLKKDFQGKYNQEKEALEPAFKSFDKAGIEPISEPQQIIQRLDEAIPGANEHISYNGETDQLQLAKYKASMPFSKEAYDAIKEVIEGANDPDLTLDGLRNIRKSISDRINWDTNPRVASQLSSIKKSLMDQMIGEVASSEPDLAVRETFKRYAINEQNRESLEKVLGGSFSDMASLGRKISPEDAINKIFSNSNTVQATKQVLGKESFDKALANYLKINIERVTDNAGIGFSSKKFATFLKTKFPELKEAFKDNPTMLGRIKAITDKIRILPDAGRANPSESATSIKNMGIIDKIKSIYDAVENPHGFVAEHAMNLFNKFGELSDNARLNRVFNFMNEGKSLPEAESLAESKMIHTGILKKVEDLKNKTTRTIQTGSKALFNPSMIGYGASRAAEYLGEKKADNSLETFQKRTQKITNYANNFDQSLEDLDKSTQSLYPHAPQVSQAMQQTMIRGMQYLSTKIPPEPQMGPLGEKAEPSKTDISQFNSIYDAVENPLDVFKEIQAGTLDQNWVESLNMVYPELMDNIKQTMMEEIAKNDNKVPYKTKIQLSLLFGQDLDMSTSQPFIAANQLSISMPSKVDQVQNPTQGGLSKLNVADRSLTPMQKTAGREA